MAVKFSIVTICGSMRYFNLMIEVAGDLTNDGFIVLAPFVSDASGTSKLMLDEMHKAKIDMCFRIYVVGEHIGESTMSEIAYAQSIGKEIVYVGSISRA